ncbi:MAG TPA: hypothetical protein VKC11_05595 [Steroidobacteraceae bacterium]|nr:hypothetical protein [Steroidobacteraceae bacterium]
MTLLMMLGCGTIAAGCATTGSYDRPYAGDCANYGIIQSLEQRSSGGNSTVAGVIGGASNLRVGQDVRIEGGHIQA